MNRWNLTVPPTFAAFSIESSSTIESTVYESSLTVLPVLSIPRIRPITLAMQLCLSVRIESRRISNSLFEPAYRSSRMFMQRERERQHPRAIRDFRSRDCLCVLATFNQREYTRDATREREGESVEWESWARELVSMIMVDRVRAGYSLEDAISTCAAALLVSPPDEYQAISVVVIVVVVVINEVSLGRRNIRKGIKGARSWEGRAILMHSVVHPLL